MTKEEFIKVLENKRYSYKIEGDKIVVTLRGTGGVDLRSIGTIPSGTVFDNKGYVDLTSLEALPPGVQFKNGWYVNLGSLKSIPQGIEFSNGGSVYLNSLIGGI